MKAVCMRHEQAYDVGTCCPWCEPDPPGRAYSFATPEPRPPTWADTLAAWMPTTDASQSFFGVRALDDVIARREAVCKAAVFDLVEPYKRLWTRPQLLVEEPNCPPGYAYVVSDEIRVRMPVVTVHPSYVVSDEIRVRMPVVTVHTSYICKVRLPE